MKNATTILLFILFLTSKTLHSQLMTDYIWSFSQRENSTNALTFSQTGSLYIAGEYNEELYFGANSLNGNAFQSVYLSKRRKDGNVLWLNGIKGTKNVFVSSVATHNEWLVIGGIFSDTLFAGTDTLTTTGLKSLYISVFDTSGVYVRSYQPDAVSADIYDMVFDKDGMLYITGSFFQNFNFAGNQLFSPLGGNMYVAKYDVANSEEVLFVNSFGTGNYGSKVRVSEDGEIHVVGAYGEQAIFGNQSLPNDASTHNMFVVKYASDGAFQWVKALTGLNQTHGLALEVDLEGNVYAAGEFEFNLNVPNGGIVSTNGLNDAFLAKLSPQGDYLWWKNLGGIDHDKAVDIRVDKSGNPIFLINAGREITYEHKDLSPNGFNEPLLLKLNKYDGSYFWHMRVPALAESGLVIAKSFVVYDSLLAVGGANYTGIEFNNELLLGGNLYDSFIVLVIDTNTTDQPVDLYVQQLNDGIFVQVYPNPCEDRIAITGVVPNKLRWFRVDGSLIKEEMNNGNQTSFEVPKHQGLYILEMHHNNQLFTTKVYRK